jgi:hypothetical protein
MHFKYNLLDTNNERYIIPPHNLEIRILKKCSVCIFLENLQTGNFFGEDTDRKFLRNPNLNQITLLSFTCAKSLV